MENLLEVKNLTTSFKIGKQWVKAIDDVSFTVNAGETLGIVGESGCGKSVTSLSILALLPQTTSRIESGMILFKGQNLIGLSNKEMSRIRGKEISMIFQDSMSSLNPVMTIGKQLVESIVVHSDLKRDDAWMYAKNLLEKVGIPSVEKRMKEYPFQLSGGMRQRVMISMALSQNPSLIIADEPTTALDVTIQAQILELMREIKDSRDDASIMLITHDMGVVAEMADTVMVMYAGKIVEIGSTAKVFGKPLHPYTQGLLGSIPTSETEMNWLNTIEGTVPTLQTMPKGCRFYDRCSKALPCCKETQPQMSSLDDQNVYCWLYA